MVCNVVGVIFNSVVAFTFSSRRFWCTCAITSPGNRSVLLSQSFTRIAAKSLRETANPSPKKILLSVTGNPLVDFCNYYYSNFLRSYLDGDNYDSLFGILDVVFLSSYAIGMFFR